MGIIDLVRFSCPYFSTPKSNVSHCLFLFLLLRVGSFRRFQVVSDDARWGGAAGKGTCRSFHNEGCSTSCIHRLRRFGKSCTTSLLSLNYFCRSHGALAGYSEACVEGTRYPAFHSITNHLSPLGPTTRHVTRTKIMALWEQGTTQRGIAKTVGCGLATVARWVHKFKDAKAAGIPDNIAVLDEPRLGAPTKLTKAIGKAIVKFTEGKRNRHLSAIRVHVQRRFGVTLTPMRIEQYLLEEGLKPFRPQKQPLLLPQQKKKRVKFAKKHLHHDWRMTLFTDESEFLLHPKQQTKKTMLSGRGDERTYRLWR